MREQRTAARLTHVVVGQVEHFEVSEFGNAGVQGHQLPGSDFPGQTPHGSEFCDTRLKRQAVHTPDSSPQRGGQDRGAPRKPRPGVHEDGSLPAGVHGSTSGVTVAQNRRRVGSLRWQGRDKRAPHEGNGQTLTNESACDSFPSSMAAAISTAPFRFFCLKCLTTLRNRLFSGSPFDGEGTPMRYSASGVQTAASILLTPCGCPQRPFHSNERHSLCYQRQPDLHSSTAQRE